MDTTTLGIAMGGTLVFLGVLIYKVIWFVRKVNEEPEQTPGQEPDSPGALNQIQSDDK
jgi:hypothetical protein